jgi:D-serine deaminase-like pyridoxal phosphate-dependent protein
MPGCLAPGKSTIDHGGIMDETPIPLVDLDRLEANLDRMAGYTSRHGLRLRPHIKTHKSSRVAAEQMRRGAIGLTCATLLETEVMSGLTNDLLLAYPPVGLAKLQRLLSLPPGCAVTVALDSVAVVEQLAEAARRHDREIGVLIELDLGMRRVGIAIEAVVELARLVLGRPPLVYRGITFYPGHIRQPVKQQAEELDRLRRTLRSAVQALDRAGMQPEIVSGGSTPTAWSTHEVPEVTEIRPGTYVYNDRGTAVLGACEWSDCALTILSTVVSTAVKDQAVIDAGSKALGREPLESGGEGFGALLDRPDIVVRRMSEEHGILDLSRTSWRPTVGEQVRIVPNHVCIAVHLHEVVHGLRGERLETSWPVAARGRRPLAASVEV